MIMYQFVPHVVEFPLLLGSFHWKSSYQDEITGISEVRGSHLPLLLSWIQVFNCYETAFVSEVFPSKTALKLRVYFIGTRVGIACYLSCS